MGDSRLFRLGDVKLTHFILQWSTLLVYTGSYYLFVSSQMLLVS